MPPIKFQHAALSGDLVQYLSLLMSHLSTILVEKEAANHPIGSEKPCHFPTALLLVVCRSLTVGSPCTLVPWYKNFHQQGFLLFVIYY